MPNITNISDADRALMRITTRGVQEFTPGWHCASGNAPSLGNGTLVGRITHSNQFALLTILLTAGSSTTFGNGGNWYFDLPLEAAWSDAPISQIAFGFDSSASERRTGVARIESVLTIYPIIDNAYVTDAAPWTWATSDKLEITAWYPLAER